ncbi:MULTISPECIES: type I restriction endonuclease subunit R, EcoR124 family [unclassified Yoonia]|uniref:type I restriction endonuclease subunit R, EcoR124 family n=1 Tax=unclassified Yoonia TaxID=2629118 RepID=UPI002AFEB2EE|nr:MULTISPECIES: hypothetical protein [unclassified Yoonia]
MESLKSHEMRRRIFELMLSQVQRRDKRDLIEAFIDQRMPLLSPDADIRAAFAAIGSEERPKAFVNLIAAKKLDPAWFNLHSGEMVITGMRPAHDATVAIMMIKLGILARKAAVGRVIFGIEGLLATFDEGGGELDSL